MLPGHEVLIADSPRPRSNEGETGQALVIAEAARGPASPRAVTSLQSFVETFGGRVAYSTLYDWAETFFREGGSRLWVSRVVSDTSVTAFTDLVDAVPAATLRVRAAGPGDYGNALRVIVLTSVDDAAIPVGSFAIRITDGGVTVETSPVFADKAEAIGWAATNAVHFTLSDLAGAGDPVRVAAPGTLLATGADNRGAITDAEWTEALARLTADLGAGQVCAPGRTTSAIHLALLEHARTRNRHAVLDLADTPTVATLIAAAQAANAAPNAGGRFGRAVWPWAVVPGLTAYSTRLVPYSAVECGLIARVDAAGNPNQASAGEPEGAARWALGLSQDTRSLTDADRESLNEAGVTVALVFGDGGGPVTYGNRTLRGRAQDPLWVQSSGSRLAMAIAASGGPIVRAHVHKQIDGKRVRQGQLAGELGVMLGRLYDKGAIFGDTPDDAYAVDTGPQVNTPETIAAGQLRAHVSFRASPGAERVTLELVRVAVTEAVA